MYTNNITRQQRTAFILLVDGSGSMGEEISFRGIRTSKAKAVSMVTNELLFELIERARRTEGIRDYYDIAVWGYSGNDEVASLLEGGDEMISVEELATRPVQMIRQSIELKLPDGSSALREVQTPEWIKPKAEGTFRSISSRSRCVPSPGEPPPVLSEDSWIITGPLVMGICSARSIAMAAELAGTANFLRMLQAKRAISKAQRSASDWVLAIAVTLTPACAMSE